MARVRAGDTDGGQATLPGWAFVVNYRRIDSAAICKRQKTVFYESVWRTGADL